MVRGINADMQNEVESDEPVYRNHTKTAAKAIRQNTLCRLACVVEGRPGK
jgi:hypothetical protein